jgi:hypothetical protein
MKQKWAARAINTNSPRSIQGDMTSPKKPNAKNSEGQAPVQSKTMYYNEGNPTGLLLESRLGKWKETELNFKTVQQALAYCRSHACNFVYMALNITNQ